MFYAILKDKVFTPNQYLNDANRRYCFVSFSFGFRQLNTIQSHLRFLVTPRSCQENPIFADSQVLNGSNLEVKHKWWESKVQHKQSAKRNSFIHLQVAVLSLFLGIGRKLIFSIDGINVSGIPITRCWIFFFRRKKLSLLHTHVSQGHHEQQLT